MQAPESITWQIAQHSSHQHDIDNLHVVAGGYKGHVGGNAHERVYGLGLLHSAHLVGQRPKQDADNHRPPQLGYAEEQRERPVFHHL